MEDLEYLLTGDGDITVVFLNGFRMSMMTWDKVYPDIAARCKVLLYNRRGVGSSKKAGFSQNGGVITEELYNLLDSLHLKPPYILVGHSLGGLYANLFACTYKDEVLAVVFVDSPHPDEILEQRKVEPPKMLSLINGLIKAIEKTFDKYKYSEDEDIQLTLNQVKSSGIFPNIPIAVVSGIRKMPFVPRISFSIHQKYQRELLKFSQTAVHYECPKSGHFPQVTEPKVVTRAIFEVINMANRSNLSGVKKMRTSV